MDLFIATLYMRHQTTWLRELSTGCQFIRSESIYIMPYSIEERDFLVKCYNIHRSFKQCQNEFRKKFRKNNVPAKSSILRLVRKYRITGSVSDQKRTGRKPLAKELVSDISKRLQQSPGKSLRKLAAESGVSVNACRKVSRMISPHLYSVTLVPQLQYVDLQKRSRYCKWLLSLVAETPGVLDRTWFTDEATFYLDGQVRAGQSMLTSTDDDHVSAVSKTAPKVGVWCAMSSSRLIGPFVFHDVAFCTQPYMGVFRDFVSQLNSYEIGQGYFQHDLTKGYVSEKSRELVQTYFGDRVMELWPPKSPDLSPNNFFLWTYLKSRVYRSGASDVGRLEASIRQEAKDIPMDLLRTVAGNMQHRLQLCLKCDGEHFQHLL